MDNEKARALKALGYDLVYLWTAVPHEVDPEHAHSFDVRLVIVEGSIEVRIGNNPAKLLTAGNEMDIPRGTLHSALVGKEGCTYIVAERQVA